MLTNSGVCVSFLPFISTTSTGTCFSLIRKISKLVTTPWNVKTHKQKHLYFIRSFLIKSQVRPLFFGVPVFLWESCPLSRTGNPRFAASAACSQRRWRGSGHGSPAGMATASESLLQGCPCPQVPRMQWCCHQETKRSPCRWMHTKTQCVSKTWNASRRFRYREILLDPSNLETFLIQQAHWLKHKEEILL